MPGFADLLDTKSILESVGNSAFGANLKLDNCISTSNKNDEKTQRKMDAQTKSLDELLSDSANATGDNGMLAAKTYTADSEECHLENVFHYLTNASFMMADNKGLRMKMTKWGFSESMLIGKWRYEQNVNTDEQLDNLIQEFFMSKSNRSVLSALGITVLQSESDDYKTINPVECTRLSTKETSMELFERLQEPEINAINANGHIKGRIDEFCGDITINSILREVLYMEESELYDTYTNKERQEFIFRIFQHLVIGGAVNQYEDNIGDYLKATKAIYRDILSAKKRDDGDIEVTSVVYEVKSLCGGRDKIMKGKRKVVDIEAERKEAEKQRVMKMTGRSTIAGGLFKAEHDTNFCYLIVDKLMRHVTMWRHAYSGAWA